VDGLVKARYQIQHTSTYRYEQPVGASFNEARLTPRATAWQNPLESVLNVDEASWQYRYVDYWGTQVQVFEAQRPHRELVVQARSLVEVDPALRAEPDRTLGWADLRSPAVTRQLGEFLTQRPSTSPPDDLAELAESLVGSRSPIETAYAVSGAVHDAMTYQPGSTGVHTVAAEAWSARSGVCQDYAHLVVGALRQVGVPARYVSGYVHPSKSPVLGQAVVGESHAWVEWWLGEWMAHDPTNSADVSDRHVLVGVGRDYSDVPPIKGIVAGTPVTTDLQVEVEITRLV
jgi:transglutaminase-like putative cysteine protease